MFGWLRHFGARVDYQTPPPEPAGDLTDLAPAATREDRIDRLDAQIRQAWQEGHLTHLDRLLDMRNAIRPPRSAPPVPVIPGRTS